MIKLFSIIRKKLLERDKVRTYLLYAFGEILLVVVGILLALQVNNWNEDRKIRNQEINYLHNLQKDLKTDLQNLEKMKSTRFQKINKAVELLDLKPVKTKEQLFQNQIAQNILLEWVEFKPSTNTFDELVSSGNLSLISNDSIKTYLLNLDQLNKEIIATREHMLREYHVYLYDTVMSSTDNFLYLDFNVSNNRQELEFSLSVTYSEKEVKKHIENFNALLSKYIFRNGLKLAAFNNSDLMKRYKQMETLINRFLKHIKSDLQHN